MEGRKEIDGRNCRRRLEIRPAKAGFAEEKRRSVTNFSWRRCFFQTDRQRMR